MKIFMIRHGVPDYSYPDSHDFRGHGNDLAPLDTNYIEDVTKTYQYKRGDKMEKTFNGEERVFHKIIREVC